MNKINKLFWLITFVFLTAVSIEPAIAQNSGYYRIQVGAFRDPVNVENAMTSLRNAGLNPSSESYGSLTRVFLPNIRAENILSIEQTLNRLGFRDRITKAEYQGNSQFPVQINQTTSQSAIQPEMRATPRPAYQTVPEDWDYIAEDTQNITIKGYRGTEAILEIPNEIEGLIVTKIENGAFKDNTCLTSVIIPNTVKRIEQEAFKGCYNLSSVTIGAGVEFIGDKAFAECAELTMVSIPERVTYIGWAAFSNCSKLNSVTIGNSVKNIGESAFFNCRKLINVSVGKNVTVIGKGAFDRCADLVNVTFEGTIPGSGFSLESGIPGNLRAVYLAANGGPGIYTRLDNAEVWWKQ